VVLQASEGKRCLPRKARSHGKVYIKRIMLYCCIYVHATREMTAHLTRRINAPYRSSLYTAHVRL